MMTREAIRATCPGRTAETRMGEHCQDCEAYYALRERVEELAQFYDGFGCFTGDCPHECEAECSAAKSAELFKMAEVLRALLTPPTGETR